MLFFRKEDFINVGSIIKTHGIKGELIIKTEDYIISEILENTRFLLIEIDGLLVPYAIEAYEIFDEDSALVKFEEFDDESIAKEFLQKKIFVDKAIPLTENSLKKQGKFLKDYSFFDNKTKYSGKILRFINIPENPLLELLYNDKVFLCPYNPQIVEDIDHNKQLVILNTPDGLFNI